MNHWWRAYNEAVDDPKLILLSDKAHRAWFNLMCVASANGGILPEIKVIAVKLRVTPPQASSIIAELVQAELLDRREDGKFEPHNWSGRQYKSDVSTDRVKRFRNAKRNVSQQILERPQSTETETDTEANASGVEPPVDHRKRLFDEGLPKFAKMTGKGPDSCRSFIGKCLADAEDSAIVVLGLIEDAERNQVADPSAWISARLKGRQNDKGLNQVRADTAAGRSSAREANILAAVVRGTDRALAHGGAGGAGRAIPTDAGAAEGTAGQLDTGLLDLQARCGAR